MGTLHTRASHIILVFVSYCFYNEPCMNILLLLYTSAMSGDWFRRVGQLITLLSSCDSVSLLLSFMSSTAQLSTSKTSHSGCNGHRHARNNWSWDDRWYHDQYIHRSRYRDRYTARELPCTRGQGCRDWYIQRIERGRNQGRSSKRRLWMG